MSTSQRQLRLVSSPPFLSSISSQRSLGSPDAGGVAGRGKMVVGTLRFPNISLSSKLDLGLVCVCPGS